MASEVGGLCQSGEKVLVSGIYRLAERTSPGQTGTLLTLYKGDTFPSHNGRAVCWYIDQTVADRKATAPLHTDWQDDLLKQERARVG